MPSQPAFAGRTDELARLDAAVSNLPREGVSFVLIAGDAGSGKTRLLQEFKRQINLSSLDLFVATGCCSPARSGGDAYIPFKEILHWLTCEDQPDPLVPARTAKRLHSFAQHAVEVVFELGPDLVDVLVPGAGLATKATTFAGKQFDRAVREHDRVRRSAHGGLPSHVFAQFLRVLRALRGHATLVLSIEDLQWVDAASADLLFYLVRNLEFDDKLLVVCTYRPSALVGDSPEAKLLAPIVTEIRTRFGDPLIDLNFAENTERGGNDPRRFAEAFIETNYAPNRFGGRFSQQVAELTHGNALFTLELLRHFEHNAWIGRDDLGAWIETHDIDWTSIPRTIDRVVDDHLRVLDPRLHELLQLASVEGQDFSIETLAAISRSTPHDVARVLDLAVESEYRVVQYLPGIGPGQSHRLRFSHVLYQQSLYRSVPEVYREQLHREIGGLLEQDSRMPQGEAAPELLRHFRAARDDELTVKYALPVARTLRRQRAMGNLLSVTSDALDALGRCQGRVTRTEFELMALQMEALEFVGFHAQAYERVDRLLGLAESLDPRSQAVAERLHSILARRMNSLHEATESAQRAFDLARIVDDKSLMWNTLIENGRSLESQGRYEEAIECYGTSLRLSEQTGDADALPLTLEKIGYTHYRVGRLQRALGYLSEGIRLADELIDRGERDEDALVRLHLDYGIVMYHLGRFREGMDHAEQALRLSVELGQQVRAAQCKNNIALMSLAMNDTVRARIAIQDSLRILEGLADRHQLAIAYDVCGTIHAMGGDPQASFDWYQRGLKISEASADTVRTGQTLHNLAAARLLLGDFDGARSLFMKSVRTQRTLARDRGRGLSLLGLACVALKQRDRRRVLRYLSLATRELSSDESILPRIVLMAAYGLIELVGGRFHTARARLSEAMDLAAKTEDIGWHAQIEAYLEAARSHSSTSIPTLVMFRT